MLVVGLLVFISLAVFHPLSLVCVLVFIVMLLSYWLFCGLSCYWFGYILVLVIISGIIIVMRYMIRLLPDEGFGLISYCVWCVPGIFLLRGVYFLKYDGSLSIGVMWVGDLGWWIYFLLVLLLYFMLLVVWMGDVKGGPLRV